MNEMKRNLTLMVAAFALAVHLRAGELEKNFAAPPDSARPWVYLFPLNGNISSNGITADLEAMKRVGIGGVLYMEVDQGAPQGPAAFGGTLWRNLFKHLCSEANRLGLQVTMNNDAGWCGSGGPWITPELSMQKVVWSETAVTGPKPFDAVLPPPQAVNGFYRDIGVFAYPTPAPGCVQPDLPGKSGEVRAVIPLRTTFPALPPEMLTARDKIVELTAKLGEDGRLAWDVPAGNWTILRLGHTSTGVENHPAPGGGLGLESDKFSQAATKAHFDGLMQKVIDDNQPLAGRTLVRTHIDSWETGGQNWTPKFREDFQRLRGYDLHPFLPAMAGRILDSPEISERFLWDVRMTESELLNENYAGYFRTLAQQNGLNLSIEAYGDGPFDDLTYAGRADEPMAEFWAWPFGNELIGAADTCMRMSSAAHVYGKPILAAEAFTSTDREKWQSHPARIKALGDWAFCEGINRFVFHRYAMQPWTNPDRAPGMSMGPWGLHYERTQTWWEQSKAWHQYLARCQYLLQQGLFVADLCFLTPEMSPNSFTSPVKDGLERPGYNFDGCPPEVLLTRMTVKDGRLVLPDGMSYRMLVLPQVRAMTPQLLRKIRDLVQAGAAVLGLPPVKSPSLSGYPQCDAEVQALARELWGDGEPPAELTTRPVGKGRVIWGRGLQAGRDGDYEPVNVLFGAKWIWFNEGNPAVSGPPGIRYFRRFVKVDGAVTSARMVLTADNKFEAWVNGRRAGSGDDWHHGYDVDITAQLQPGTNIIAVSTENTGDLPNPAGLLAAVKIEYADGRTEALRSDGAWEAARIVSENWKTATAPAPEWQAASELGPLGMSPWGAVTESPSGGGDPIPDISIPSGVLAKMGVPPDFQSELKLRHIHKTLGDADIYFVANPKDVFLEALCTFRVTGKQPELWRPDTGRMELAAVFEQKDGVTRVPLRFEPSGSVFVVFRKNAAKTDSVVSVSRDGELLISAAKNVMPILIQKATYGVPDRTRDVRAKVQSLVDGGRRSFGVAEMAGGDDPAVNVVKTLDLEYTVAGKSFTASGTDPETISLKVAPEIDPFRPVETHSDPAGNLWLEAWQAGNYDLETASGRTLHCEVGAVPPPVAVAGPWEVSFDSQRGGPARPVTFEKLEDWSQRPEKGIRYYSGTATYRKTFTFINPKTRDAKRQIQLDLGKVAVMAEVKLNGKNLGILWKPPFRVDITDAVKTGKNALEVKVVNLWINRQIGDELLPEDSDRNPDGTLKSWPQWLNEGQPSPAGRYTFTSWRLWKKGDPLVASGLLGPVTIRPAVVIAVKP